MESHNKNEYKDKKFKNKETDDEIEEDTLDNDDDDTFDVFPIEDWTLNMGPGFEEIWEDPWEKEPEETDFFASLREEIKKE